VLRYRQGKIRRDRGFLRAPVDNLDIFELKLE